MIHEKTWITCDRCGAEIKDDTKSFLNRICFVPRRYAELKTLTIDGVDAAVNKEILALSSEVKVLAMDISFTYRGQTTGLHLCPKCRKDFEKFMKGEL